MTQSVKLSDIRIDGGTQARAELNEAAVADYAEALAEGATFPPVTVFFDGSSYWLADGFHRFHAHRKAKTEEISADVRPGTVRDAKLFSAGANGIHGLRRSNEDKRRAVMMLLVDEEWSQWSDREIARQCGVGNKFVGDVRRSVTVSEHSERTYTTKHGTTAHMDTAKIGRPRPEDRTPEQDRAHIQTPTIRHQSSAHGGLTESDRISELEDSERFLLKRVAELEAKVATFERLELMYRDWTEGGWDKVVQAKEDTIAELQRTAQSRIAHESGEKVKNLNAMRGLAKKLDEAGKGRDIYIDLDEAANG